MKASDAVEELRLLHSLTVALDKCESLSSALAIVLREVCRATGWKLGEAWIPTPDGAVLIQGPIWHDSSRRLRSFASASRSLAFRLGEGLPGRVWSSGKPAWVSDVRKDGNFPRRHAARRVGIKAGLAIPVLASGETIAVIAFFLLEERAKDRHLIHLVSAVAAQLGGIIRRRVAEEALKRSRYELEAESRERKRVGRELHDGVTQLLSTTLFRLRGLKEGGGNDTAQKTARVEALLEQAIREVRRISTNLDPGILEELGLCAALRTLGRDLEERIDQSVVVSCQELPPEVPRELSWTIYRILQEGVQNIEKHAGATSVRLTLGWQRPWLRATLRDNGRGFAPAKTSLGREWQSTRGLRNMKERAAQVGGSLSIRSSPGEGSLIALRIPWDRTSAPQRRIIP
jgi:signal transduction histidine kinase